MSLELASMNMSSPEKASLKLVVASGKGGTGKTTVSTALALAAAGSSRMELFVTFVDCDVEEPNSHIFLKPEYSEKAEEITTVVPKVVEERCNYCGACRDICRFNAITVLGKTILAFPDMCHSCQGCFLVCEQDALVEDRRTLGWLKQGKSGPIQVFEGLLRVGEAMSSPLIKALKKRVRDRQGLVVYDAPPGTSCPVIKTMTGADYVLLVTEPTPFGLHDLKLCAEVVEILGIPFGVVINRAGLGNQDVEEWCRSRHIPILMEIPFKKEIAGAYARGISIIDAAPELKAPFEDLLLEVMKRAQQQGRAPAGTKEAAS